MKKIKTKQRTRIMQGKDIYFSKAPGRPVIGIIMGSPSDWETMACAAEMLDEFSVPYEARVVSAHRTPQRLFDYATTAADRGLQVLIAGAGGAAHLPGMAASLTSLPVFGVPVETKTLKGHDSLLSIVQMPAGVPVGTLAIGKAGAKNAALIAIGVLALSNPSLSKKLNRYRQLQTKGVPNHPKGKVTHPKLTKSKRAA